MISNKLNCFIKQAGLFVQHLLEIIPGKNNNGEEESKQHGAGRKEKTMRDGNR